MCRFKSGIILKTRCVVAEGADDSHSDLLDSLGIEDTEINAMTKFVRAELLPPNDEWWTDPDRWEINIDQDILPDWYKEDEGKYNEEFRKAVKEWCRKHILLAKNLQILKEGYYLLKDCNVGDLTRDVTVRLYNATVQEMYGNATVQEMYGNATVQEMRGNATVQEMRGNATVQEMWDNATVQEMYGNATVQEMRGNATVQEMYGNATVQEMWDNATVQEMRGNATVQQIRDNAKVFSYKEFSKIKQYVSADSKIEVVAYRGEDM